MQIYLVGGAVRDQLLGLPVTERDWVVVGATVDEMLKQGFRPVGKDFPVFLHPVTHEEYALARTERKIGRGYTGFDFHAAADVTLVDDLKRRDLTINAIAETEQGEIVDPYEGVKDLKEKWLRHVSPAFVEDPVRILRVGRFAARFAERGFKVAPETLDLMKHMVKVGEVDALVAERVWKELVRALAEKTPSEFFQVLAACDALSLLFPMIRVEDLQALNSVSGVTPDPLLRFAGLFSWLDITQLNALCVRYRIPSEFRELAALVIQYREAYLALPTSSADDIVNLLQNLDAFRREERFQKCLIVWEATMKVKHAAFLKECYAATKQVDVAALIAQGFSGKVLAKNIYLERVKQVRAACS